VKNSVNKIFLILILSRSEITIADPDPANNSGSDRLDLGEDLAEAELPAEEGRDGGLEEDSEEEHEEEVEDRSRGIVWSASQALK